MGAVLGSFFGSARPVAISSHQVLEFANDELPTTWKTMREMGKRVKGIEPS